MRQRGWLWRQGLRDCFAGLSAFCILLMPQSVQLPPTYYGGSQKQQQKPAFASRFCSRFRVAENSRAFGVQKECAFGVRQLAVVAVSIESIL
jgi:hypothetical protein